MVPVKIECGCGQHYAFDAEPVNGLMPSMISCPGCGKDGTAVANEIIAQSLAAEPDAVVTLPARAGGLRLSASEPSTGAVVHSATSLPRGAPHATQLGLVDRNQAEVEARAKVSWGDPPEAVIKYLMIQGFTHPEATDLVNELFKVRAAETRANGLRKIAVGSGMVAVPIIALLFFLSIHFIPLKIMGLAIAVGIWGFFKAVNGMIMVVAPKMETGDVAEQ
jgi:hypothetical protein